MLSNKTTYIGLTLGPIFGTLEKARKTRELWAASYLFSWLMGKILHRISELDLLKPQPDPKATERKYAGAGHFPDRLILEAQPGDFERVQNACLAAVADLAKMIAKATKLDPDICLKFTKGYFQTYLVQMQVPEEARGRKEKNPIFRMDRYLDTLELEQKFTSETASDDRVLSLFFQKVYKSELTKEAFQQTDFDYFKPERDARPFKSLVEISTSSLSANSTIADTYWNQVKTWRQLNNDIDREKHLDMRDQLRLITGIKNNKALKPHFRTHHKYVAMVSADGDNIGKILGALGPEDSDNAILKAYSKGLAEFRKSAANLIADYLGIPVFIGGDDLLFLAPIFGKSGHVFDLLITLDQEFKRLMDPVATSAKAIFQPDSTLENDVFLFPSLSFGVSISYYKFPLFESHERAWELLQQQAKKQQFQSDTGEIGTKNAVAFQVLMHSGSWFGSCLSLESPAFSAFRELLGTQVDEKGIHLNSITYAIQRNAAVFREIAGEKEKIKHFLENSFNESIHEQHTDYLASITQLLHSIFRSEGNFQEGLKQGVSCLRLLNFLKKRDHD